MGLAKMQVVVSDTAPDTVPEDDMGEMRARPEELRLLEAMLFAASEPLDEKELAARLPEGVDVRAALTRLQKEYALRGVNLVRIAGKWTFRTATDLTWLLSKETVETRKLSRAAIETLAIIAYHQPVTRAEIEAVRGVRCEHVLERLLDRHLIRDLGRKQALGRPILYGTTEGFLRHFGLRDLDALPPLRGNDPRSAFGTPASQDGEDTQV